MGPGDTQRLRPFPQFSNVTPDQPVDRRLQLSRRIHPRREARLQTGSAFLAHYTGSRFMDDVESSNEYGSTGSYMDAYHRDLDWAASASDVPHHFVMAVLYDVRPFTGQPVRRMPCLPAGGSACSRRCNRVRPSPSSRPRMRPTRFPQGRTGPIWSAIPTCASDERTLSRWFNTAAFANPAPFTFGNSPRSVLRGPGLATTDLTLEKNIALTSRMKLDVRAEAYNLLNRVNLNTARVHIRRRGLRRGLERETAAHDAVERSDSAFESDQWKPTAVALIVITFAGRDGQRGAGLRLLVDHRAARPVVSHQSRAQPGAGADRSAAECVRAVRQPG